MIGNNVPVMNPFAAESLQCRKCGSYEIAVTWHAPDSQRKRYWDCECGKKAEHLYNHCRTCGYHWTSKTKDAK